MLIIYRSFTCKIIRYEYCIWLIIVESAFSVVLCILKFSNTFRYFQLCMDFIDHMKGCIEEFVSIILDGYEFLQGGSYL